MVSLDRPRNKSCSRSLAVTMSTTIDDIEEAIEFVDEWEQVMKAERVIARRVSQVSID